MVDYDDRLLLDTNIILYILKGRRDIAELVHSKVTYLSIITELELLSYPEMTRNEEFIIQSFLTEMNLIEITDLIKVETKRLRRTYKMKLPDSIIAATASYLNCALLTADKAFKRLDSELDLKIVE